MFDGFFFEFLTSSTLGGCNFFNYILFLTIFSAPNAPYEAFQYCLDTRNNGALHLDLAYLEHLNVIVATRFAINEKLKDLTDIFFLESNVTNYIKKVCFLMFSD